MSHDASRGLAPSRVKGVSASNSSASGVRERSGMLKRAASTKSRCRYARRRHSRRCGLRNSPVKPITPQRLRRTGDLSCRRAEPSQRGPIRRFRSQKPSRWSRSRAVAFRRVRRRGPLCLRTGSRISTSRLAPPQPKDCGYDRTSRHERAASPGRTPVVQPTCAGRPDARHVSGRNRGTASGQLNRRPEVRVARRRNQGLSK